MMQCCEEERGERKAVDYMKFWECLMRPMGSLCAKVTHQKRPRTSLLSVYAATVDWEKLMESMVLLQRHGWISRGLEQGPSVNYTGELVENPRCSPLGLQI